MATNTYSININANQAQQALNGLQQSLQTTNNAFNGLRGALGGLAIGAFVTDIVKSANEMKKLADATGLGVSAVSNFQKEFKKIGGTANEANDAISDFVKNIGEATIQGGEVFKAFQRVGIGIKELQTLSEKQLLGKALDGLKDIADPATRSATAMKLFGGSVKGLDLGSMSSDFARFTEESLRNANAITMAAKAERDLANAFGELKTQTLVAIAPLADLLSKLLENKDATRALVSFTLELATALAGLYVVKKVVDAFIMFRAVLVSTAAIGSRFFPLIAAITTALIALNEGARAVTGNSLVEWFIKLKNAIFGGSDASDQFTQDMADQKNESEALAESMNRRIKFLEKEKAVLDNTLTAYQRQNDEANRKYSLDTKLIGASEEIKNAEQARFEARIKYEQEIAKLQDQYKQKQAEGADPAELQQLVNAGEQLTAAYDEQRSKVDELSAARTKATQAQELELFSKKSLVDSNRQYTELVDKTANLLLPELNRKYKEIEQSARAAAEAQIASEEARRQAPMGEEERLKYYEAAKVKIAELQAATYELDKAERKRALNNFSLKEKVDLENAIAALQLDSAKIGLSEIDRKEKDILESARLRAKAEIDAAEAARQGALSTEEQEAYYTRAEEAANGLIKATREHYNLSREWGTGWKNAMAEYVDNATNAAAKAKDIFGKAMTGMEDLLVNFAKTGKFEWKNFVNMMLEELLRAQIQSVFAKMVMGMQGAMQGVGSGNTGGGAGGGGGILGSILGGIGDLFGGFFANGGTLGAGKWGIAGENGPEIIQGPANVISNKDLGGSTTVVNYNISAVDAMSFKQMIARDPSFIHAVAMQGAKGTPGGR